MKLVYRWSIATVLCIALAVLCVCGVIIRTSSHAVSAASTPVFTRSNETLPNIASATTRPLPPGGTLRCAVIGGMTFTGFWQALADRYERDAGVRLIVTSTGEKSDISKAFKLSVADVITMHASDAIINLVADGYAVDPQPWMKNDMVIIGPASDPAKIKGSHDAADALRKIIAAKCSFIIPPSLGVQEVLRNLCTAGDITLDPARTTLLLDDPQRQALHKAAAAGAYTIVGRIPFRTQRMPSEGMIVMVDRDPALRRPFMVAAANPARLPGVRADAAKAFAAYLRTPATQHWISNFGRGLVDPDPLFFPVTVDTTH